MIHVKVSEKLWVTQHVQLCDPMDCSPPGSSVHRILQARILEWVVLPFSRGSLDPGIKPGSPTMPADPLQSEPPGKPQDTYTNEANITKASCEPMAMIYSKTVPTQHAHWQRHNRKDKSKSTYPLLQQWFRAKSLRRLENLSVAALFSTYLTTDERQHVHLSGHAVFHRWHDEAGPTQDDVASGPSVHWQVHFAFPDIVHSWELNPLRASGTVRFAYKHKQTV